ncbi:MAG: response regulator [Anaerolineaceae bacterium]|nr:response regulator [Anaerolineaceae bacterium]
MDSIKFDKKEDVTMENKFTLIVEDNALLSKMFSRALKDIHYDTMIIADGQKALGWLEQNEPDVLFLDMHLPLVSGKQILETICDDPRFSDTYIVIITADARMGEMMAEKADFLLNKPVDIGQLQQLAERLKREKIS